jgi:DNA-binding XRE family transcriptional regulator
MEKNIETMSNNAISQLVEIGQFIRQHRKSFKITANAAAETAGISRVTLHRIEKGEPSVSMGGYLNAISALGLHLQLAVKGDVESKADGDKVGLLPVRIALADYPQLKELAWHVPGAGELTLIEAHSIYERNKRFLESENLIESERELIEVLKLAFDGVVL